jgi:hypothetical protein
MELFAVAAPAGGPGFPAPDLRGGPSAALLFELSANAFDAVVHAWMSELPLKAEIIRFAGKVIAAARAAAARGEAGAVAVQSPGWAARPEARRGAENAAFDRGDPDVRAVLDAARKVERETDRLMGLLRFTPVNRRGGAGGPVYVARCSPDHYVLPGLAEYFTRRFGACPWAIIDEKRNLILAREGGGEARLFSAAGKAGLSGAFCPGGSGPDPFEELWRNYHTSINNPDRNNPVLQRQFMPRRYWKYLPELR